MTRRMNKMLLLSCTGILIGITCVTPPVDPVEDPKNAEVFLFLPDGDNTVEQGTPIQVGMRAVLPRHIDFYRMTSTCGDFDTTIQASSLKSEDTVYLNPQFQNEGTCTLQVTAEYLDTYYKEKTDTLILIILPDEPVFDFSGTPNAFTTHTGATDTLRFIINAPEVENISYTVTCDPEVDSEDVRLITSVEDDTVLIHFDPDSAGTYTVMLGAAAGELSATASVTVTVLASIAPASEDNPQTLIAGTPDTLIFTLTPEQVASGVTMELLDAANLPAGIATVIPGSGDSIIIAVNPAEEGELSFSIATTNGTLTDTAAYTFSFVDQSTTVWATASAAVDAMEGEQCSVDLTPYLFEGVPVDEIDPTATIGSFNDSGAWTYTPPWGSEATVTVTITGKRSETLQDFSLTLNVAPGDETAPEITLLSPATESKIVSSSQTTVSVIVKDAGAGVEKVTFATAADSFDGTADNDSTYTATVTGLTEGTATEVIITATDKSMKKNSSSKTITFTYDPAMEDGDAPVFSQIGELQSGDRVTIATGTLTCEITDDSGVDSVWWTLNDVFVAAVAASNENEYTVIYKLSVFGENVIVLYAKDGSSGGNEGSRTIILNYNTEPSAITLTTPAANATDVATSATPMFEWSGGDDTDGDNVTFTVNYGTSKADLSSTASVSGKTATVGTALAYNTTYYWQVTGTSASTAYPDVVESSVDSFTTEGTLPTITVHPQSQPAEEGESVTFSVTASANGFGTLTYQWREDGTDINGEDDDSYTISSVTTDMDGNTYDCVVSNEVGPVTSNAATLTVSEIVYHTVSFWTENGTPKPNDTLVKHGTMVQRPSTDPHRNGYAFTDWYIEGASSAFNFTGTQITDDLQLVAGWKEVYTVTYHADDADGGTVPTDPNEYENGDWVIVANNTGNLSKDGNNYTFIGWTTSQTGSGTVYTNPQTIQVSSANIDLYAKWEMNAPTFTTTISNQSCPVNDAVTFNVAVIGADLSYEWQLNGITIPDETGSSYTTSNLTTDDLTASSVDFQFILV